MMHNSDLRQKFDFQKQISIRWSDLDANGHLNSRAMARYFEDTRVDYLIEKFGLETNGGNRIGCVITELFLRYHREVMFPATLCITIGIICENRRKIDMGVTIWNRQKKIVASGYGTLFSFDFRKKKLSHWPDSVYKIVKRELNK